MLRNHVRTGWRWSASAVAAVGVAGVLTAATLETTTPPPAGATGGTAVCGSPPTCFTPQQLEVAYGVTPLLRRGIDGRGETVVLPELAESQASPPVVTDLRQDFVAFDRVFHLAAPKLRVVSTFAGPSDPWLAFGEEVLDAEVVHSIAPRAALTIVLVKGTSLDSADQAVTASVAALRMGASQGGIISLSPAGQIGGVGNLNNLKIFELREKGSAVFAAARSYPKIQETAVTNDQNILLFKTDF